MSNDIDGVDEQIERLQNYLKTARQTTSGTPTLDQLAIEQALAAAYAARELQSIKQLLNGLTVLRGNV
jgi:hypothetical protein